MASGDICLPPRLSREDSDGWRTVYPSSGSSMSSSITSTPYRARTQNIHKEGANVELLKAATGEEARGCTLHAVSMSNFLRHLMRCDSEVVPKILADSEWQPLEAEVNKIAAATQGGGNEAGIHAPFLAITEDLLVKAIAKFGVPKIIMALDGFSIPDPTKPHLIRIHEQEINLSKIFYDTKGSTMFRYHGTRIMPDGVGHKPLPDNFPHRLDRATAIIDRVLTMATRPLEFKKKNREEPPVKKAKTVAIALASVSEGKQLEFDSPPSNPDVRDMTRVQFQDSSASLLSPARSQASASLHSFQTIVPSYPSISTGKRKLDDLEGNEEDLSAEETANKALLAEVRMEAALARDHCQLAVYAMACLASSARLFTTGIFVDGFQITMFYYDRQIIFQTKTFDFNAQPQLFVALLYSMLESDFRGDGFNPFLHEDSCVSDKCQGCIRNSIKDCVFKFPANAASMVQKEKGATLTEANIANDKLCASFAVKAIIHEAIGILGRATAVYNTKPMYLAGRQDLADEVALKLSWQPSYRQVEMTLINGILEKAPHLQPYLPELVYGGIFTPESLGIPSAKWDLNDEQLPNFVKRALHVIASKLYHALWTAVTVEEFMTVWLDCIRCHHDAWEKGRVLHRDLSENNLMFALQTKPGVDPSTKRKTQIRRVRGIVNDWDMASVIDDAGQVVRSSATHRTGTLPFMSPDLLKGPRRSAPPQPHWYRHDLESFFYILLYAMVRYDLPKKMRRDLPDVLRGWHAPTLHSARDFKAMLLGPDGFELLAEHILPVWKPLWMSTGLPLLYMFNQAHGDKAKAESDLAFLQQGVNRQTLDGVEYDFETCNGQLTYETFIDCAFGKGGWAPIPCEATTGVAPSTA